MRDLKNIPFSWLAVLLSALVVLLIGVNLSVGYVSLSFNDFVTSTENNLISSMRINRVWVMILAGLSIPTSGFLLQEYFQNPLAGPSVLGISSVASLSVALYLFLSYDFKVPVLLQDGLVSIFAVLGSFVLMLLLLVFAKKFTDSSFLIIFGFLISALAGAVVSVLQLYADNQSLKNYVLWSFGANSQVTRSQVKLLTLLVILGLLLSSKAIKPLIPGSLGKEYSKSLGVNLEQLKYIIILSSSLLSASVTAFLGPILFIGIVVPHFSRLLYNPSRLWHQWLLNLLIGMIVMLGFSILSELTLFPINVITSLFGIPVILLMLLKSRT